MAEMALYFAYGSNMRSTRLEERVGAARVVGAAQLRGWSLRFDKPGRDGTGKANIVPTPEARVWGVAWELSRESWPVLDRFEPGYRRERFRLVTRDGGSVEALAYVYPSAHAAAPPPAPSAEYLSHLIAGAREHRLPAHWVEAIRSAARGG